MHISIKIASGIIFLIYFIFFIIFTSGIFEKVSETIKCHNIDFNYRNKAYKANISGINYVKLINKEQVDKSKSGTFFNEDNINFIKFCIILFWILLPFCIGYIIMYKKISSKIYIGIFLFLCLFYLPYFIIITDRIFNSKETIKITCDELDLTTTISLDGIELVKHISDEDITKTKTLNNIIAFKTSELGYIKVFTGLILFALGSITLVYLGHLLYKKIKK